MTSSISRLRGRRPVEAGEAAPVHEVSRRTFCRIGLAAAGAALLPRGMDAAAARTAGAAIRDRHLALFNTHTDEHLDTVYCWAGTYLRSALAKVDYVLRDHRANEVRPIDVTLLDLLDRLSRDLRVDAPYHVISGYRSPRTNAMLRARGGASTGVATGSLHMEGKAIDIRVPGVPLKELHRAAVALKRGGVGIYPGSDFVHVDVGRVRYWSGR